MSLIDNTHNKQVTNVSNDRVIVDNGIVKQPGQVDHWLLSRLLENKNNRNDIKKRQTGKRICILSIDTRPLERFSVIKDFDNMSFYSIAAYNSLFYAMQHGYDYRRVTAPLIPGYHRTWVKIAHMYNVIHEYDIIVCVDPDVYVRDPRTSIEFLMDRYNFTENSSFLMAPDPNGRVNYDSKNRPTLNMGFIIARNNNLTKHMLKQLVLCGETVPGCQKWKHEWSHEQRAFSEYFRDQMKVGSELIIASCPELNGYDESTSGCRGSLILHVWTAKHTMKDRLRKLMLENLMHILEKQMWGNRHISIASTSDIRKLRP